MKKILSVISGLLLISCSTVLAAAVDQTRRQELPPELSEQTPHVPDGYQRRQQVAKGDYECSILLISYNLFVNMTFNCLNVSIIQLTARGMALPFKKVTKVSWYRN